MFLFTDILLDGDECTLVKDECGTNAFCTNTNGSYDCTCNSGHTRKGFICSKCLYKQYNELTNDNCAMIHTVLLMVFT